MLQDMLYSCVKLPKFTQKRLQMSVLELDKVLPCYAYDREALKLLALELLSLFRDAPVRCCQSVVK